MDRDEHSDVKHEHMRSKSQNVRYTQDYDKDNQFTNISRRNTWQESKSKHGHVKNKKDMCCIQNMHYINHERREIIDLQAIDQQDQELSKTLHRIHFGMKIIKTEDTVEHIDDMLVAFKKNATNMTPSEAMQLFFARIELNTELSELKEKLANVA